LSKSARYVDHLYYKLDGWYDTLSKGRSLRLFGRDGVVVAVLDRVAQELQVEVMIAILDRHETAPAPGYSARKILSRRGRALFTGIPIHEKSWMRAQHSMQKARGEGFELVSNCNMKHAVESQS
jgi:hypothetical protein